MPGNVFSFTFKIRDPMYCLYDGVAVHFTVHSTHILQEMFVSGAEDLQTIRHRPAKKQPTVTDI